MPGLPLLVWMPEADCRGAERVLRTAWGRAGVPEIKSEALLRVAGGLANLTGAHEIEVPL